MAYITYMTYINHNYVSCVGHRNTHYEKSYFFTAYEKLIKHILLLTFL